MDLIFVSELLEGVQNNDIVSVDRVLQYDNVDRKHFNVNGMLYDPLLHVAARNNNFKICQMLLKFGADVNMLNLEDQSPLNVAESNKNYSICKLLVKRRKRKEKTILYDKALHIFARKNDLITCKKCICQCERNRSKKENTTARSSNFCKR